MSRGNRISLIEAVKRRDSNITGVNKKISQQESQKIDFIVKVLDFGLKHKKFSVVDLQKNLDFSRNSIDRTLHLLLEKKFIIFDSLGLKNKKFYKIKSKNKAKQYREDLLKWKMFKIALKTLFKKKTLQSMDKYQRKIKLINKILQRNTKLSKFQARDISYLELIPLKFSKKQQERITAIPWPDTVYLKSIFATHAMKIIDKYLTNRLCDFCLKDGELVDVQIISDYEGVCIKYGHSFLIDK